MAWKPPKEANGCWINGNFYYYPLYAEIETIRSLVEGMGDEDLVEEMYELEYEDDIINDVIFKYLSKGSLTQDERARLVSFYVVSNIEDYLVIDEEEEW